MKITSPYRHLAPVLTTALLLGTSAMADMMLPSPYISRALDAVLLPIDDAVITGFALDPNDTGALVLAVQPGGIAEAYGILPGDVVSFVGGVPVNSPIDLDTIVYFWISQGTFDFVFDGYRGTDPFNAVSVITYDSYYEMIEVSSVESWSSYSYESFSYSEFYAEYSSEMTETYESSETMIEETASSEEFMAEVEAVEESEMSDEAMTDDAMADADGDGVADDADGDGVIDDSAMDEDAAADDTADDGAADDGAADDASADDSGGEDAGGEDAGGEDAGGEDAGDGE